MMINDINWTQDSIQKVNNLLIIMGNEILNSGRSQEDIYKACYALPSDPSKMTDWCDEWIHEEGCNKLVELIF
jgi:hypothetical protein